jgi:ApaG protein
VDGTDAAGRPAKVVVIDSLNGYLNAMPEEKFLTAQMHELLAYLGQQGVVTLMTVTQSGMVGSNMHSPVDTTYLAEQSNPGDGRYVFAYTITIRNEGSVPGRLVTRHWIITDSNGKVQEVRGEGVVGEQPYLKPGQRFRYSSGAVLETPVGAMQGSYQMVADDGQQFDAPIAAFRLAMPGMLH